MDMNKEYSKKPYDEWDDYDKAGFTLDEKDAFIAVGIDAWAASNLVRAYSQKIYLPSKNNYQLIWWLSRWA